MPTQPFRVILLSLFTFCALNVIAQNTAPDAFPESYTTDWDSPVVSTAPGVLANDLDAESDTLQAHLVQGPENGNLSLEIDGSFTYQPEANFEGRVCFTYKAWDGMFGSDATVTIDVVAGNLAPVAVADHYVSHGEDFFIDAPGVLLNDRDPENDILAVWPDTDPANGTFGLANDGSFYFYPDPGFYGQTTFTYTLFDGLARSQGTVTLSIAEPPNQAPVLQTKHYDFPINTLVDLDVLANDYDPEGTELFISRVCCVTPMGSAEVIDGGKRIRFRSTSRYRGQVELAYFVTDGEVEVGTTITATVGMEQPPFDARDDYSFNGRLQTLEDAPLHIDPLTILANDVYPPMPKTHLSLLSVGQPENGTTVIQDGEIIYTANPGFFGTDRFGYTVGYEGHTDDAIVNVRVDWNYPLNARYDRVDTPINTPVSFDVLANDHRSLEGREFYLTDMTGPTNGWGTLTHHEDGRFTYTPLNNFVGTVSFDYTISDGEQTDSAPVVIWIGERTPPVAQDEHIQITTNRFPTVDVLANDRYIPIRYNPLTLLSFEQPTHGYAHDVNMIDDESGLRYKGIRWVPPRDFVGQDQITYTIEDQYGQTAQATIYFTVVPYVPNTP